MTPNRKETIVRTLAWTITFMAAWLGLLWLGHVLLGNYS